METLYPGSETGSFSVQNAASSWAAAVSTTVAQPRNYRVSSCDAFDTRSDTDRRTWLFRKSQSARSRARRGGIAARGDGTGLKGRLRVAPTVTFARHSPHSSCCAVPRTTPGLIWEVVLDDRQMTSCRASIFFLFMGCGWERAGLGPGQFVRIGSSKRRYWVRQGYFERGRHNQQRQAIPGKHQVRLSAGEGRLVVSTRQL